MFTRAARAIAPMRAPARPRSAKFSSAARRMRCTVSGCLGWSRRAGSAWGVRPGAGLKREGVTLATSLTKRIIKHSHRKVKGDFGCGWKWPAGSGGPRKIQIRPEGPVSGRTTALFSGGAGSQISRRNAEIRKVLTTTTAPSYMLVNSFQKRSCRRKNVPCRQKLGGML